MKKCIITVVGKDKIGIIGTVCQYLSGISVNILNISQTIVEGYFNMMTSRTVQKKLQLWSVKWKNSEKQLA